MNVKCKNPYLDSSIDKKSAFLFGMKMLDVGLNIVDGSCGYKKNDIVFIELITKDMFDECINKEVSIYEFMPECVPDGMRYNKELDKLVPDVIEDKKNISDEYIAGIKIEFEKVPRNEQFLKRENGFIKADYGKLDFSLVDPFAYSDLAFQLTFGAKKYSKDNWKKGDINIYLSALERHIQDIKKALDKDDIESLIDDTGIQHGGALLCNSMFIHYFIRQILKDKNAN